MRKLRLDQRVGLLLGAVLLLVFVALGASVALPATDPALRGRGRRLSKLEAQGMEIYRSEGCWYCHTQYVRNTATDTDLGEPRSPDAYAGLSPAMLGLERTGPDLTHFGTAGRASNPEAVMDLLRNPDEDVSYRHQIAYLSERELRALAEYLLSLK